MYGEVHANRVLYKRNPKPGHRYRQVAVLEKEQFQVCVFEGEVIQTDPNFDATSTDAGVYLHSSLEAALGDAEKEFQKSIAAGWIPYAA